MIPATWRMKPRLSRLVSIAGRTHAVVWFTLVVAVILVTPAAANTFDSMFKTSNTSSDCTDLGDDTPSVGRFCQTDNSSLTYYTDSSLTYTGAARVVSRMNNVYAPTNLSVTRHTTAIYTGSSETDIIFLYRDDLPGGTFGRAWCDDAVSSLKCDQHYAAFSNTTPPTSTICHEAGHSIGLTHGAEAYPVQAQDSADLGCMKKPSTGTITLPSNITDQIDDTYE